MCTPYADRFQEFLDDIRETQLSASHLTHGAACFLCNGRLWIKTNSFFDLGSSPSGIVELLISQTEMVTIRGIVWDFFDCVFHLRR